MSIDHWGGRSASRPPLVPSFSEQAALGHRLVDRLMEAEAQKRELRTQLSTVEQQIERCKEELAEHARVFGVDVIRGSAMEAVVRPKMKWRFPIKAQSPRDWAAMEAAIKAEGFWEFVSSLNHARLHSCERNGETPCELRNLLHRFGSEREVTSVSLRNRR